MGEKILNNIKCYFREYCSHTSVHGFQYFGENKRTLFERIWWFFIFLICSTACIFSVCYVYQKWEQSPVIVNFANKGTPIDEIPFPAVTICPESKSGQDKFNFTKLMQKKEDGIILSLTEETQFEYISLICNYYPDLNYTNNKTFSHKFYEVLDEIRPSLQIINCSIFGETGKKCAGFFRPIITEEGICYTFNMLDRSNIFRNNVIHFKDYHKIGYENNTVWSLQSRYTEDAGFLTYPLRAYLSGATNGFSLYIVTPMQDTDYACKDSLQGYRVLLHTPMTIPRPSQKYFRLPLDQSVVGAIEPTMITTSKRIEGYDPQRRKCYFSEERYLKYFKNYTLSNCKLECITNYTLKRCDCVNFYMPRENGTNICGTGMINCMREAEREMKIEDLKLKIAKVSDKEILSQNCYCLPVCSDLTYHVETSQTDWNWKKWLDARRSLPRIRNNSHLSSLTIFFQSDNFITTERNELYGPLDFLANFGGVLGLFTGFSVLSLMELLYFLTIRLICNLRLYGQWAVPEIANC